MGKILLLGDSILMIGLAAQLRVVAGLEVLHVPRTSTHAVEGLGSLEAIIIDLSAGPLSTLLSVCHARPDLLLLGLDSADSSLTVLSGPSCPVQSSAEVLACIAHHLHHDILLGGGAQPHLDRLL